VVDHQRPGAAAVGRDVGRIEPLRQHAVDLHRAALPRSFQLVARREFQLRYVERAFARIDLWREAALPRGIASFASDQSQVASLPERTAGRVASATS
jgi:hypothetical protein